eukprot:Platyproteum_vivax@DN2200_c0_g1_i1.p1
MQICLVVLVLLFGVANSARNIRRAHDFSRTNQKLLNLGKQVTPTLGVQRTGYTRKVHSAHEGITTGRDRSRYAYHAMPQPPSSGLPSIARQAGLRHRASGVKPSSSSSSSPSKFLPSLEKLGRMTTQQYKQQNEWWKKKGDVEEGEFYDIDLVGKTAHLARTVKNRERDAVKMQKEQDKYLNWHNTQLRKY